jgi:hypothetical protein
MESLGKNNTLGNSREPPVQDLFWRQPLCEERCTVSMPRAKAAPLQGSPTRATAGAIPGRRL